MWKKGYFWIFVFSKNCSWPELPPGPDAIVSSSSLESFKSNLSAFLKLYLHIYLYLILYHYFILFYGWCNVLAIFTDFIYVDVDVDEVSGDHPHWSWGKSLSPAISDSPGSLCFLNPLSPKSDQRQISPCNITALQSRVFMRIKDMITQNESSWYFNKFSPLLLLKTYRDHK